MGYVEHSTVRIIALHNTRAGLISIGLLVLTAMHHYYGGLIYRSNFRFHVAVFGGVGAVAILGILLAHRTGSDSVLSNLTFWWLAIFIATTVGVIGMMEGGYNHLLKNVLYFSNASSPLTLRLFPLSSGYVMPNNALFEITGLLQFFVALPAGYYFLRSLWTRFAQRVSKAA